MQVQRFLGHSDPGFTLRTYVHLLPEDLPALPFDDVADTVSDAVEDGVAVPVLVAVSA